jgi:hypothetical protein
MTTERLVMPRRREPGLAQNIAAVRHPNPNLELYVMRRFMPPEVLPHQLHLRPGRRRPADGLDQLAAVDGDGD